MLWCAVRSLSCMFAGSESVSAVAAFANKTSKISGMLDTCIASGQAVHVAGTSRKLEYGHANIQTFEALSMRL